MLHKALLALTAVYPIHVQSLHAASATSTPAKVAAPPPVVRPAPTIQKGAPGAVGPGHVTNGSSGPTHNTNQVPSFSNVFSGGMSQTTPSGVSPPPANGRLDFGIVNQTQPKPVIAPGANQNPVGTAQQQKQLAPVAIGTTAVTTPMTATSATAQPPGRLDFGTTIQSGNPIGTQPTISGNVPVRPTVTPQNSQNGAGGTSNAAGALTVNKSGSGVGTVYTNSTPSFNQKPSFATAPQTPISKQKVTSTSASPSPSVSKDVSSWHLAKADTVNAVQSLVTSGAVQTGKVATSNGYIYPAGMPSGVAQQQCAVLVQALHPEVGPTQSWLAGQSVTSNTPPGTPIATFAPTNTPFAVAGHYPGSGKLGENQSAHSAIVVGPAPNGGLRILEQFNLTNTPNVTGATSTHETPARIRTIPAAEVQRYSTISTSAAVSQ